MNKKAIFLDFDGTLTDGKFHIWKFLWKKSGYAIDKNSYYAKYKNSFLNGEISYEEWCEQSLKFFKLKGLSKKKILTPAREITLLKNVKKFIKILYRRGFDIYILSGNFKEIIKRAIGKNLLKKIIYIQANEFSFKNGFLDGIIANDCDYEAKPKFVEKIINERLYDKRNVIFIGNGANDEKVKSVGVKTICINAEDTNYLDKKNWDNYLFSSDMMECLRYIKK